MKQLSVSQFCLLSFFLPDRNSHLVSDTDPGPPLGPASGLGSAAPLQTRQRNPLSEFPFSDEEILRMIGFCIETNNKNIYFINFETS